MSFIADNLADIERRIENACLRSGRSRDEVRLVAVSKTKPASMIEEALSLGILDFGENRPQELRDKADILSTDIRWHMIGRLQRNKVKYVVGRAVMIHSLDSYELAMAIEKEAEKRALIMPVLVEVNMGHEESKGGINPEAAEEFIRSLSSLKHLSVRGLMTVAPLAADPEDNRQYFRGLNNLAVDIAGKNIDNISMCDLSMGMTDDFETAIEEGATIIRVGSGIFGARDYGSF